MQVWFPEEGNKTRCRGDICFVHGVTETEVNKNLFYQTFHSLVSDLCIDEEEQLSKINKNVRYEIRRSNKEDVYTKVYSSDELMKNEQVLTQFGDMYEQMYKQKGMDAKINFRQINEYVKTGSFLLTAVCENEKPLVFHSYIMGEKTVRLLHSVSDFRSDNADANMIARTNKRLHWDDICLFKKMGKEKYDWGGISDFENPNGIDAFKLKFGGTPVTYYNQYEGISLLGKIAVSYMKRKSDK